VWASSYHRFEDSDTHLSSKKPPSVHNSRNDSMRDNHHTAQTGCCDHRTAHRIRGWRLTVVVVGLLVTVRNNVGVMAGQTTHAHGGVDVKKCRVWGSGIRRRATTPAR
jgi:hypothetical protein